ncbi:hypothetical protein Bca52824_085387 [Brassica carinata]|uniref:Uncharacterized protein n=1 Tax=Brassica carinata TaxID=52824 RepID=A0A8X7TL78_BRACI|nr:hypothetical protein Bca52824_085387 [Brassica carinata]
MDSNSWINHPSVFSSRRCQSRSGGGYEDLKGEDDSKSEFICPFCADVFDIVGLCCHIDEEHPVEAKNGMIPIKQPYESSLGMSVLYAQRGSPSANEPPKKSATSVAEGTLAIKLSLKESLKREIQEAPLSGEDQQKAKKSEFVRGLLLSTILRDDLMMHA